MFIWYFLVFCFIFVSHNYLPVNNEHSGNEVLLQPITFDLKRNYLRAVVELQSTYVVSEQFRIKFLRTEFFQIHQAVVRYLLCLNLLEEYFGDLALLRPILLEDLTKREQKIFKAGCRQLLPSRDTLGRRSIVNLGNFSTSIITDEPHRNNPDEATTMTMNDTDQLAFIRIDLYFKAQVLAEDISTQRNGYVTNYPVYFCLIMFIFFIDLSYDP